MKHEFYEGMKVKLKTSTRIYIVDTYDGDIAWVIGGGYLTFSTIDWVETEELNKEKTMETFTKADLKSGDKVVYRNGDERFVLIETGTLHDKGGMRQNPLSYYSGALTRMSKNVVCDIMKVYRNDELIWEREEKSQAQLDYEKLMEQIKDLQEKAEELKNKLFT